ncbi:hypothetical protein L218DRAFT_806094, partial [Marasmius fiardii PR-910]
IGYFLNWGLFGALCVQVFLFYWAFPKDKLHLKLVVYGLFASDIVQTAIITRDAFFRFGTHFGDGTIFLSLQNLWFSVFVINAIDSAVVQLFFAYRITVLSKSKVLGTLVAIVPIEDTFTVCNLHWSLIPLWTVITFVIQTFLSIAAACDVLITASMVIILSQNRGAGLNPATSDAVTKIIWLTVETGKQPSEIETVVAILTMALKIAFPTKAYCNIMIDIIGKIYSNNFLVILNRRIKIMDSRSTVSQSS